MLWVKKIVCVMLKLKFVKCIMDFFYFCVIINYYMYWYFVNL